jgi:flagellar assembly protein FliH
VRADPYLLEPLEPTAAPPDVDELHAVVSAARAEADTIRDEARAEGLLQGRLEGEAAALAEARAQLAPAVAALAAAERALVEEREQLTDRIEARAVELAVELAEKIVAGALEARPERVLDAIRGALRCLLTRDRIQVLVHPEDLPLVRDAMGTMAGELGGIEHVEVLEERRVDRGGAIVRTADAEVDATVRTKLERARELLADELERA